MSISFREEYRHLYEYLQRQPNKSDYICRLLQKELDKEKSLEEKLSHLINLISDKNIVFNTEATTEILGQAEQRLNDSDIDLINNLF